MSGSSFLNIPEERQSLISALHDKYHKAKRKQEALDTAAEEIEFDKAWAVACDDCKFTGILRLCWRDLKHISNRVYNFQSSHGRVLQELVLDGIGLTSLESICEYCPDLIHLSLASNEINDITGIHNLRKLSHLNLLRNNLTHLPTNIGLLTNLTKLEIANNKIVELPNEIEMLKLLKHLNLESNELSELPVGVGRLNCDTLCLNCNKFAVFPDCVTYMPKLTHLSIMANQLIDLPAGLARLKHLESFRASRNRITICPDSVVDMKSLTCLWLDSNRLAALPASFHKLSRLKEIKLDGNVEMIYPPMEVIAMGVEEVFRWSRNRLELNKTNRVKQIVDCLEEVLSLVRQHKIGGELHDSLFVADGEHYQFPPDVLWSVFLPELRNMWANDKEHKSMIGGIKSFPYEREEVEQAMFDFRDAAGGLVRRVPHARFSSCSCVQTGRSTNACIPTHDGRYFCERPALIVRMKVAYEENMLENRRLREEQKRIDDAVSSTEAIAKSFLSSEDGIIMVREEAEKRLALLGEQDVVYSKKGLLSSVEDLVFGNKRQRELKNIEQQVRNEYIRSEIAKKREEVVDGHAKSRHVMKKWIGVSTQDVFHVWKKCVDRSKKILRKEQRRTLRDIRLRFEDEVAAYELKLSELSRWEKRWDEYNDVQMWVNTETNESSYEAPTAPSHPAMPPSMIDLVTGKPLSPRELSPRVMGQNEADTSSDEEDSINKSGSVAVVKSPSPSPFDNGRDDEVEQAKNRVHEMRLQYNMIGSSK